MQVRILKPGVLTTVQDLGRYTHLSQAVPVSGAMDTLSARIANMAVGNNAAAAVIEYTYGSAEFKAETDILIAYAGDGAILKSGINLLPANRPVFIPAGTLLQFINNAIGSRTYLAITGGWDIPEVLGSRSTYITAGFGGFNGRPLAADDVLNSSDSLTSTSKEMVSQLKSKTINYPNWSIARRLFLPEDKKTIHVITAREFSWFDENVVNDFFSKPYRLSLKSNRMGYQLEGATLNRLIKKELLSTAVTPGTIQVAGNGSPIILMADCQTTGGYPRIAQVAAIDLPLCAQLKPGDLICFKEITQREAEMQYLDREQQLQKLTFTIQSKFL